MSAKDSVIVMTYFSFTSLSTVGFGDFHPRGNLERIYISGVLLIGVSVFSYIMGNFIEIIGVMGEINGSFNDGDNLTRFFGLIKRFNNDRDINRDLMLKIEDYFEYKWEEDVNLAIITDEDFSLLNQLQYNIQCEIYHSYLFKEFLYHHRKFFEFQKEFDGIQHSYYNW
jgi:hypothetical protein